MASRKHHDDSAITRRVCVFGLVVSYIVAISSLLAGAICLYIELRDGSATQIVLPHMWREILPLVLNIFGMSRVFPEFVLALTGELYID